MNWYNYTRVELLVTFFKVMVWLKSRSSTLHKKSLYYTLYMMIFFYLLTTSMEPSLPSSTKSMASKQGSSSEGRQKFLFMSLNARSGTLLPARNKTYFVQWFSNAGLTVQYAIKLDPDLHFTSWIPWSYRMRHFKSKTLYAYSEVSHRISVPVQSCLFQYRPHWQWRCLVTCSIVLAALDG